MTHQEIIKETAKAYGVTVQDIKSGSRKRDVCQARFAAASVLRDRGVTLIGITESMNSGQYSQLTHTASIHWLKRHDDCMETDPQYRKAYESLESVCDAS